MSRRRRTPPILILICIPTGYDQGVFGGIIVTPNFLEQMGNPGPGLQGAIVSLYDIGWYVFLIHVVLCCANFCAYHGTSLSFFGAMSAFVFGKLPPRVRVKIRLL